MIRSRPCGVKMIRACEQQKSTTKFTTNLRSVLLLLPPPPCLFAPSFLGGHCSSCASSPFVRDIRLARPCTCAGPSHSAQCSYSCAVRVFLL